MATETEELKLRVTLDDQASAQLNSLRQNLTQLGSGPVGQGLQNITSKTSEAEKAFVRLTRAQLGVTGGMMDIAKAAGPWAGALALAVVGIQRHMAAMKEWAASGQGLANAGRMAGTSAASLQNIQEGLAKSGISAQQAAGMMQQMQAAISEAGRPGSAVREGLMRLGGVEFQANMANAIDKLTAMKDIVDRTNFVRHIGLNAYANDLKRHHDEAHARFIQAQVERMLGAEQLLLVDEDIAKFGQQKYDNINKETEKQKELNAELAKEEATRNRIWQILQASMASVQVGKFVDRAIAAPFVNQLEKERARMNQKGGGVFSDFLYTPDWMRGSGQGTGIPSQWPGPKHQRGGIVTQPHIGMIGEAGPEAIIPLDQLGDTEHVESIDENTKQLKMLNYEMERILAPFGQVGGVPDIGDLLSGGPGGRGGGGGGGGGGRGPTFRPGIGPGSRSTPGGYTPPPGTPGGAPIDMSSIKEFMSPQWQQSGQPWPTDMAHGLGPTGAAGSIASTEQKLWPWPTGAGAGETVGTAGNDLSKTAYDKMFAGSKMAGQYDAVVSAALKNNIPPSLMAGIIAHESDKGRSHMIQTRNNPAGLMDPATGMSTGQNFPTIEEGIDAAARTIARNYNKGGRTVAGLQPIYAPIGAANDPQGTNRSWLPGVSSYVKQLQQPGGSGGGGTSGGAGATGGWNAPKGVFAGYGPYGVTPTGGPTGPANTPEQINRPMYMSGVGTIEGGAPFGWGSGMPGRYEAIPPGDYPVTPGAIGPWGVAHGAIGINNNAIRDPKTGTSRLGIEIHSGSGSDLDRLYTEGCFRVAEKDWPRVRQQILDEAKKGPFYLHVRAGTNGGPPSASFTHNASLLPPSAGEQAKAAGLGPWPDKPIEPLGTTIGRVQGAGAGRGTEALQDSSQLDKAMGDEVKKHDVDTSGTIKIRHGRRPTPQGRIDAAFKDMPTNRQTQMMPANDGPLLGTNAASGI